MKQFSWYLLLFAWIVSLIATLGSLFFSEVMGFPPCTMCWYQRICMYPLVLILLIGLIRKESSSLVYAAPLLIVGWFWSFYHTLLIFEVIKEDMTPCSIGVPCSTKFINWFGFIDIPLLALVAFTIIATLSVLIYREEKQ
ncbi:MAG: disulfide bond formation protein B [Campylobacteraceae bacterium]|nr:disulfide bond formation protein B [Campylobacteraceae bacterium]